MSSRGFKYATVVSVLLSVFVVTDATCASKKVHEPRPISRAEAAAVEMVADFLSRGPEAVYERLAPESPLASLPRIEALAEIEVRTGPTEGAEWNLQTIVPSLADRSAVFGVEFASGIDDVVEVSLVEHNGSYQILSLRSFSESSSYAIRTSWMVEEQPTDAPVEESSSLLKYFPFIGGLIAALSIASLSVMRVRPVYGKMMLLVTMAACVGVFLAAVEFDGAAEGPESESPGIEVMAGFDRLGTLLEQRRSLASGAPMPAHGRVEKEIQDVAAIWKAQVELRDLKLDEAKTTLERFPAATDRPMVALLRARLGASKYDVVASSLAYERTMRLGPGRDELWFETAQWLYALGFEERALGYLERLPEMGSRNEDVYYALASIAGSRSKKPEATSFLRTAWKLAPVTRAEIVGTPALTAVMRLEEAKELVPLSSPVEPRFRTDGDPSMYIDLPDSAGVIVTGSSISIELANNSSLSVAGGAVLVDSSAEVVDAVTVERRDMRRALDDLDQLLLSGGSPTALANPAVRERFLRTAQALAERDRWEDMERLTRSLSASAENVPPDLVFLRGSALRKLNREYEARSLLAEMVASPAMERRSDARILYQLGEMLAAMELYTPAIRTLERVDAMMDDISLDDRIRQLSMNQRLAENYSEFTSPNFIFHYPDNLDSDSVERISVVMEAELTRLRKIIPLSEFRTTTINVVWWNEFRSTYTGSDHILGFYDGKITLPLAGISSLQPTVVALMTHELAHAVIAQASNDRASAWIQEGLAQRVESVPYHANAFNMYESDRLLPLSMLNAVLSDSVDVDLVGQAYITSQTVVRFLESKYGTKAMPTFLSLLREGQSEEAALTSLTGKQRDELEMEFREWGRSEKRVFENKGLVRYDTDGRYKPVVRFSKRSSGQR